MNFCNLTQNFTYTFILSGQPRGSCVHSTELVFFLPNMEGKLRPLIQAPNDLFQGESKQQSCRWPVTVQQVLIPIVT